MTGDLMRSSQILLVFTTSFFLFSCVIKTKHSGESPIPKLETEEQKKDRLQSELEKQNQMREKSGYSVDWQKVKSSIMGSPDGAMAVGSEEYKWTHKFYVRMECQLEGKEIIPILLRFKKVKWKLNDSIKGEAESDSNGMINFTVVTSTQESFSNVEFDFKKTKLNVPVSEQGMSLIVPKKLCTK